MSHEHEARPGPNLDRRDVLKGLSATGAGAVGATAASERARGGAITGGCAINWPDPTEEQLDLAGGTPTEVGNLPTGGHLVIYVHGFFGESLVDGVDIFNGSTQATALDIALAEQNVQAPVVAGMWEATTTWSPAKDNADEAGAALAAWVADNRGAYETITVFGHSLGSRVTLEALAGLADTDATITSAGLLGPGVGATTVCDRYADGIRRGVERGVYTYHSAGDAVVCAAYPLAELVFEGEEEAGLGCEGSTCGDTPENYVDVDTSDRVEGHCNYFKPTTMDFEGESAIPEIVDRQIDYLVPPFDGTLAVTVTNDDGETLADVTVPVTDVETGDTVATLTTDTEGAGTVSVSPGTYELAVEDAGFRPVTTEVAVESGGTVPVHLTLEGPPPVVGDQAPRDLHGDGLYRDVRGDGVFDIMDVQTLFDNLDSPAVQDNAAAYNFSGKDPERVTIFDVQALHGQME